MGEKVGEMLAVSTTLGPVLDACMADSTDEALVVRTGSEHEDFTCSDELLALQCDIILSDALP